jgi:hypothetical protein
VFNEVPGERPKEKEQQKTMVDKTGLRKLKDRATQTLLTTRDELKGYGMVGSFCSSSGTCRVILVYT